MDYKTALDPQHSVVVEACAGSGKTWLLVSRIVRLLLAGVAPSEILAITFTRRAAQEMQARLHEWLHFLAVQDDQNVRAFLHQRGVSPVDDAMLARARGLLQGFLLTQPALTINTFHGWFMQIMQRAPLNAGMPLGMQLLERTSAFYDEAWEEFLDGLNASRDSEAAHAMQWLFVEYGLHGARMLLKNFIHQRAEWWAYTIHFSKDRDDDEVAWALQQLRTELDVDMDGDPIAIPCADASLPTAVRTFAQALATGTKTQCNQAEQLQKDWEVVDVHQRFTALVATLYTQQGHPRSFKPTKNQNENTFVAARDALLYLMQSVRDALIEQKIVRLNEAVLRCGTLLLEHFQGLKRRQQQMDFTDLEWQVCRLLNQSDCAEYMQYKLDSRYRHVLLDEFQDTNPLQWQILQAWFSAAAAVDTRPTVFVVGDPKQSIYRFRRADARLFSVVREFLQREFSAHYLTQNETRRNAPAVLNVVNAVFASLPEGFVDFEMHVAHHQNLPGHVEVLPLSIAEKIPLERGENIDSLVLRNPLLEPRLEKESGAREIEAAQFAAQIAVIVAQWSVQDEQGKLRRAEYRDIMVLVRKRSHLRVYERALRALHIPFLSSRRGGLLDTLEAEDIQALLTFLITPFADLQLAQTLRSPIFSCSDQDLMLIASYALPQSGELSVAAPIPQAASSWWTRLKSIDDGDTATTALQRAHHLLQHWLQLADKLPVHDLLDRIYFESDLLRRYAAVQPLELRASVQANLQAFMEIALNVDAGRYPSLPRFLAELRELRRADDNEAPDEGRVGEVGNALRIYTVHEAKGLEAPIVWLLDTNDVYQKTDSYGVLLDWPPNAQQPQHFSLFSTKDEHGAKRLHYFEAEENYARREQMNLLYVAMTRARQALLVSGHGELNENSWYARIERAIKIERANSIEHANWIEQAKMAASTPARENPLMLGGSSENENLLPGSKELHPALSRAIPTGRRVPTPNLQQRRGIWLHALLQHLATAPLATAPQVVEKSELQVRCGIPTEEMESLWQLGQHLLKQPALKRFFDPQQYHQAVNEMPYVNAAGQIKRIDRLVEFENEIWLLDYKTGGVVNPAQHRAQMEEYRAAIQTIYAEKSAYCALIQADGSLIII